jgi:hypothetical protein
MKIDLLLAVMLIGCCEETLKVRQNHGFVVKRPSGPRRIVSFRAYCRAVRSLAAF